VPLYVTARGLTTSPMDSAGTIFQADVDLIDHQVIIQTSGGDTRHLALGGGSVADFYAGFMSCLEALGIDVEIRAIPDEVSNPIPFAEDHVHAAYDPEWANRFFVVLSQVDIVMKAPSLSIQRRHTPVHFFWGTFDSGLFPDIQAPSRPPAGAGLIARRSADAEQICCFSGPDTRSPGACVLRLYIPEARGDRADGAEHGPRRVRALRTRRSKERIATRFRSFNSSKAPMPPGRSARLG